MNAFQKTTHGGAECWEPVGEGAQAAIIAAANAIAELNDVLNAGMPATTFTETLGTAASESPNMLYVAGQRLESIGRLEDARRAYRAALEATAQPHPQKPLRQELQTTKWSQRLCTSPEVQPGSGVDDMRATLLYHLAHAFLLEGGRVTEAVETATQAVELSPQSGEFSLSNQDVLRSPGCRCAATGSNQLLKWPCSVATSRLDVASTLMSGD